jgi:hypothetical protein
LAEKRGEVEGRAGCSITDVDDADGFLGRLFSLAGARGCRGSRAVGRAHLPSLTLRVLLAAGRLRRGVGVGEGGRL